MIKHSAPRRVAKCANCVYARNRLVLILLEPCAVYPVIINLYEKKTNGKRMKEEKKTHRNAKHQFQSTWIICNAGCDAELATLSISMLCAIRECKIQIKTLRHTIYDPILKKSHPKRFFEKMQTLLWFKYIYK